MAFFNTYQPPKDYASPPSLDSTNPNTRTQPNRVMWPVTPLIRRGNDLSTSMKNEAIDLISKLPGSQSNWVFMGSEEKRREALPVHSRRTKWSPTFRLPCVHVLTGRSWFSWHQRGTEVWDMKWYDTGMIYYASLGGGFNIVADCCTVYWISLEVFIFSCLNSPLWPNFKLDNIRFFC